ncbi:cytochrome P450 [Xylariales sp. AK1849]|nr:cytochrome P450 [Xylariales sp. AK1849]
MELDTLSPWALVLGVGVLAFVTVLLRPIFSWSWKIPGPFLAKYTKWWYAWHIKRNDLHWINVELHRKNGKIVQVMPGYFTIDDPEAHKIVYGHAKPWVKGEFYEAWHVGPNPKLTNLFASRDPAQHAAMRRKVAAMYSMSSMVSYEPYVDHCIELLHEQLDSFAGNKTVINLGKWLQYFAFDAVSMITFGERLGFLDHGRDVENMIQNLNYDHAVLSYVSLYPWMTPYTKKLSGFLAGDKIQFFMRFATEKIKAARQVTDDLPAHGPVHMVRKFLDAQRKDEKKAMTDWDVTANAGSNIGAGSDTTAIGLISIVYYLYRDRNVLERLRAEIAANELSAQPTFQETQKLAYMQVVIKESIRIQPGVGLPLWREVPKGGAAVCGQFFPAGTNIGVNPWVPHHSKEVFGPDADEFRPERWLEASGERAAAMEQCMVHFGLGSRTCIGRNVSLLEINKVLPVLVRDFDFAFMDEQGQPETRGYVPVNNKWFIKVPHLYARVNKRNTAAL